MTAIEAFKAHFQTDTVPGQQLRMALRFGGNNDPETIRSIPMQADHLWVYLFRIFGRPPTKQEIMDDVDLRRWESLNGRGTDNAKNGRWSRTPAVDNSGSAILAARDLLIEAHYLTLFGRRPDDLGMAYWRDQLDKMIVSELRDKMISGATEEDKARMGQ